MDLAQLFCTVYMLFVQLNLIVIWSDGMKLATKDFNVTEIYHFPSRNVSTPKDNENTGSSVALNKTLSSSRHKGLSDGTAEPIHEHSTPATSHAHAVSTTIKPASLKRALIKGKTKTQKSINSTNTQSTTPAHHKASHRLHKSRKNSGAKTVGGKTKHVKTHHHNVDSGQLFHNESNFDPHGSSGCSTRNCSDTNKKNRHRKHMHNHWGYKQKFYNYKMLYNTIKHEGEDRRKETEFYAWIFGATMLTLGSLTTMTSCFIFCFCGDKWRRRRRSYRYNKDCSYQRVDSVSSVVDSSTDHVTII